MQRSSARFRIHLGRSSRCPFEMIISLRRSMAVVYESSIGLYAADKSVEALRKVHLVLYPDSWFRNGNALCPMRYRWTRCVRFRLSVKSSLVRVNNPALNRDHIASKALEEILTIEQLKGVVHQIHLTMLESDLKNLVTPRVRVFLGIPNQELPLMTRKCALWQERIDAKRLELELEIFRDGVASLPKKLSDTMSMLYAGVWSLR